MATVDRRAARVFSGERLELVPASRGGSGEQERWKADVALLRDTHRNLRSAVAALDPKELISQPKGSKLSRLTLITGIAAHDLYHAGQIQLLKRLAEDGTD